MPEVGQFHHTVIEVSSLDRSIPFYGETLGLDRVDDALWPAEDKDPHAVFRTGAGQYIVLAQVENVKPDGPAVHTNFMVSPEDFPPLFERLKAVGSAVADHLAEQGRRSIGEISTYFDDPDGHRLQITAFESEEYRVPAAERGRVVAGRIDDFAIGSVTLNREGKFFLVRTAEGFLALNQVCTHMHCLLMYQPAHYRFYCACHDNRFTRSGEHLGHSHGVPPMHEYRIEFVGDEIVVDTDTSLPRTVEETDRMVPVPAGAESAR